MILLIDNRDSFVHNLARYFRCLGQPTMVQRCDQTDYDRVAALQPQAIVLSPGPCGPDQAGCSLDVVRRGHQRFPILGVCLGHQCLVQALGGRIRRSRRPVHGQATQVWHDGQGVFQGIPSPFAAGRYHSLIADPVTLPDTFDILARTADQVVMAVQHRHLPLVGLQFHPESILTQWGMQLLDGFLRLSRRSSENVAREVALDVPCEGSCG